MYNGKILWKR